MRVDDIFQIQSMTQPITVVAVLVPARCAAGQARPGGHGLRQIA